VNKLFFTSWGRFLCLLPIIFAAHAIGLGLEKEYFGKLDPGLTVNCDESTGVVFKPVDPRSFPWKPGRGEKTTSAKLYYAPTGKMEMLVVLVEKDGKAPVLYADVNIDQKFEKPERFVLKQSTSGDRRSFETIIKIPINDDYFTYYPVCIKFFPQTKTDQMAADDRFLSQSIRPFARGKVNIEGRSTSVIYRFNAKTKSIISTRGLVGIDGNQDGEVDMNPYSPEVAEAHDESVIFRVGAHYVSTKSIDPKTKQVILREHPAEEYSRVELRVGVEPPDFEFTDFEGTQRRLSEYRGKYVLLDFWGTWCRACHKDTPGLLNAYERFHSRGFEIVGMNTDEPENFGAVKMWLEKNEIAWTQATLDSIRKTLDRYRIQVFPTTILLGPDGKILSLNQQEKGEPGLRGEALTTTLDRLLPPAR
jgi:peroxiredoxin